MLDIVKVQPYKDFLAILKSSDSKTAYASDLSILAGYLKGLKKGPLNAKPADFSALLSHMREKGHKDSSIARRWACIRRFYKWMVEMNKIKINPTNITFDLKTPEKNPKALTPEQRDHLIKSLKWDTYGNQGISLAVLLGLHCGLRLHEINKLKWSDIILELKVLKVIGKGQKEAILPLSDLLVQKLGFAFQDSKSEYVFSSPLKNKIFLSRSALIKGIMTAGRVWAGFGSDVIYSPHVLRHSYCQRLANGIKENKIALEEALALSRHAKVETFLGYVKVDKEKTFKAFQGMFN